MLKRPLFMIALTALMAAAAVPLTAVNSKAVAGPDCRPVNGHIRSQLLAGPECTSPVGLCTAGRFIGGIHGDFVFVGSSLTPNINTAETGVFHYTGEIVIQAKDGEIRTKDTGAYNAIPGSSGDLGSVSAIRGGTGKYEGATGYISIRGTFTPEGGGDSDYRGEICTQ